jgi:hypothetical protein
MPELLPNFLPDTTRRAIMLPWTAHHRRAGVAIKDGNLSGWPAPGLPSLVLLSNLADLLDQLS